MTSARHRALGLAGGLLAALAVTGAGHLVMRAAAAREGEEPWRNRTWVRSDSYRYITIARDGYAAVAKMLSGMSPERVIETVSEAKLRGRGGAGFPTGTKWRLTRQSPGDFKYIICNADEGDPGAFMDRAVLEGDPHSVIEGMIIAAYAIGAGAGATYADVRIGRYRNQFLITREDKVQNTVNTESYGCGVRVIADGTSKLPTDCQVRRAEALAEQLSRKLNITPDAAYYPNNW